MLGTRKVNGPGQCRESLVLVAARASGRNGYIIYLAISPAGSVMASEIAGMVLHEW